MSPELRATMGAAIAPPLHHSKEAAETSRLTSDVVELEGLSEGRSDSGRRELYLPKDAVVITCIDREAGRVCQHDRSRVWLDSRRSQHVIDPFALALGDLPTVECVTSTPCDQGCRQLRA